MKLDQCLHLLPWLSKKYFCLSAPPYQHSLPRTLARSFIKVEYMQSLQAIKQFIIVCAKRVQQCYFKDSKKVKVVS